jgi:signal transduction histidine kinase
LPNRQVAGWRDSCYRLAVPCAVQLAGWPAGLRACNAPAMRDVEATPASLARAQRSSMLVSSSMRDAVISVLAVAAGICAAALVYSSNREPTPTWASAVLAVLVGWAYIGSGLIAWRHRPELLLAPVMTFIGFAWFVTFLADSDDSALFTLGTVLENVYLLGFVYLVLSFPSGRLRGHLERILFVAAIALTIVVEIAYLLLADSSVFCTHCPKNALQVIKNDGLAEAILQSQRVAGLLFSLFTALLLLNRWRRASTPQRRAVSPLLWTGGAMFGALALSIGNDIAGEPLSPVPTWTRAFVFAAIPVAVLGVMLQRRLARGAVAGLVVELQSRTTRVDLHEALGRALGDPSLELAYWLPGQRRYVDSDGLPVELPAGGAGRVSTVVLRDGEPVAAVIHDVALRDNPELVDSACAAAALALENERLRAELLAQLAELQASRARLAEATDTERQRIERDLHDGTQQRLVAIAMTLGLAESKLATDRPAVGPVLREARDALALALDELRDLSQGIRPAILVERGLPAALDDLSRRAALPVRLEVTFNGRLHEPVEAVAYFVASEALANAAKHSYASEVRLIASCDDSTLVIKVADNGIGGAGAGRGSGLRGLADRVEAIGGRLTFSSPSGRGTTIRAEIPCE